MRIALAEAQRLDNRKALKELRAIGPPPYPASSLWTERTWLQRLEGQLSPKALWKLGRIVLGGPEVVGLRSAEPDARLPVLLDAMWAEVSALNLIDAAPALQMPVFFFLGRHDHWVPPETSVAYFDALSAPSKQLVWFEDPATSRSWTNRPSSTNDGGIGATSRRFSESSQPRRVVTAPR